MYVILLTMGIGRGEGRVDLLPAGQTATPVDLGGGIRLSKEKPWHGHQHVHQGCKVIESLLCGKPIVERMNAQHQAITVIVSQTICSSCLLAAYLSGAANSCARECSPTEQQKALCIVLASKQ